MTPITYQVEMNAETYEQLEKPGLTYLTREGAMSAIRSVLLAHGRVFTVEENEEEISFLNERGGCLGLIRTVRALGQSP